MGITKNTVGFKIDQALVRKHDCEDADKIFYNRLREVPQNKGLSDDELLLKIGTFLHRLLTGYPFKDAPGLMKRVIPDLSVEDCVESIKSVLANREVAHHIILGYFVDMYGEKLRPIRSMKRNLLLFIPPKYQKAYIQRFFDNRLIEALKIDYPLYGPDVTLGQWIACLYGVFGYEMFGFLDASKLDMIKETDEAEGCHVFSDDLLCGVVAAAYARLWTRYCTRDFGGPEETIRKSREIVASWLEDDGITFEDLEVLVHERQSKYHNDIPYELAKEGFDKVFGKSEIYLCLLDIDKQRDTFSTEYEKEVFALKNAMVINQKYGTVGNSNIGMLALRRTSILNQIKSTVVFRVVCALVASANGYVAHEMESRQPDVEMVVRMLRKEKIAKIKQKFGLAK